MQGDEEHRRVLVEDGLGAVAVVDVPVDDRDPVDPLPPLRVAGGDRDVVEDAEPHRLLGAGVMAGRADEREAVVDGGVGAVPSRTASQTASVLPAASSAASQVASPARASGPTHESVPFTDAISIASIIAGVWTSSSSWMVACLDSSFVSSGSTRARSSTVIVRDSRSGRSKWGTSSQAAARSSTIIDPLSWARQRSS